MLFGVGEKKICLVCRKTQAKIYMCAKCHSVGYCGSKCQKMDLQRHKKLCAPVVFKEIGDSGRGLIATKDIGMGYLILKVEADYLMEDYDSGHDCRICEPVDSHSNDIHLLNKISQRSYEEIEDDKRFEKKDYAITTHNKYRIFPIVPKFRHKCCSNATTNVVIDNPNMREIRAIKDIKKGEEVTINYLFTFAKHIHKFLNRDQRQKQLKMWNVVCDCNHCLSRKDEDKIKDMIHIKDLRTKAIQSGKPGVAKKIAQYQKKLVDKLEKTYLAPYLMPIEVPHLVLDSHVAGFPKMAINGKEMWSRILERRNADIFNLYFDKTANVVERGERCLTYYGTRQVFIAFLNELEINIF